MEKINFFGDGLFYEIDHLKNDSDLIFCAKECIDVQKTVGAEMLHRFFRLNPNSSVEVSEQALDRILISGEQVSDIRSDRSISNCVVFNSRNMEGSVMSDGILKLRNKTNALIAERIKELFQASNCVSISDSGHFGIRREVI